jgi:hypothetical protein
MKQSTISKALGFTVATEFTSLQDMAYNQAKTGDMLLTMANYAKANIAGFPESITDEGKAELYAGYRQRYNEVLGTSRYAVIDNVYIPIEVDGAKDAKEQVDINVAYAFSFSQQQFGQLSSKNPQLHSLIKQVREKTTVYCSNRLADLKKYAKGEKTKGTRPQALNFNDWLKQEFITIRARAKTANARGEVINEKKLSEAIVEFNVKYNHGE